MNRRPRGRRQGRSPLAVGLAGIVVIVIGCYLAWTKHVPFTSHYELHATFSNSSQIIQGSPVREAGVDVGEVTGVTPGPGTTADLTMAIDDDGLPIRSDAIARIRPRVFLEGGFFVDLEPGSPGAPALDSGATLPIAQTAIPVQFDQIVSVLQRPVRDSLRDIVKESAIAFSGGGAAGLRRAIAPLPRVLRDTALVTHAARGTSPLDIQRVIGSTAKVTHTLAERDAQLADLVTSLDRTATALVTTPGALGEGIAQVDSLLRESPAELRAVDATIPVIGKFANALKPTIPLAPPLLRKLHLLGPLLARVGDPTAVVALLNDLVPTIRNLPRFSLLARGLFPTVGPIVSCVQDKVMPTLKSPVDDGSLSTGKSVWLDFMHANVGLASSSQNFDANGPWARYLAPIGPQTISTGTLPGVTDLIGTAPNPILGSRPTPLSGGRTPPLRPDAPCEAQAKPDLAAKTAPAETAAAASPSPAPQLGASGIRHLLLHPPLPSGGGG